MSEKVKQDGACPHQAHVLNGQYRVGACVVAMSFEYIEEALGLPEGIQITAVHVDAMRQVLEFRFDGPGLPPVHEAAEPLCFDSLGKAWEYRACREESLLPVVVAVRRADWEKLKDLPESVDDGN